MHMQLWSSSETKFSSHLNYDESASMKRDPDAEMRQTCIFCGDHGLGILYSRGSVKEVNITFNIADHFVESIDTSS